MKTICCDVGKICLVASAIILAIANPNKNNYQKYARDNINNYLKKNTCSQVAKKVSTKLDKPCLILVDTATPHLNSVISQNTKRRNFLFFSIYETEIQTPSMVNDYYFETVGIFDKFYTYQAEEIN